MNIEGSSAQLIFQGQCRVCQIAESDETEDFLDFFSDLKIVGEFFFTTGLSIVNLSILPPALICPSCLIDLKNFAKFKRKALEAEESFRTQSNNIEQSFWQNQQTTFYDDEDEDDNEDIFTPSYPVKEEPEFISQIPDHFDIRFINENNQSDEEEEAVTNHRPKPKKKKKREEPLICEHCHKQFSSSRGYQLHMVVAHNTLNKVFVCKHCRQIFKCESYLSRHVKKNHDKPYVKAEDAQIKVIKDKSGESKKPAKKEPENIDIDESTLTKVCPICNKTFTSVRSCKNHITVAHSTVKRVYVCKLCNKKCKLPMYIRRHLMNVHDIVATENDYSTTDVSDSDEAYEEIDSELVEQVKPAKCSEKKTFCELCLLSFSRTRVYYEHMKIKHDIDDLEYVCQICDEGFIVPSYLVKHTRKVHGVSTRREDAIPRKRKISAPAELVEKPATNTEKIEQIKIESSDDSIDAMMEFI